MNAVGSFVFLCAQCSSESSACKHRIAFPHVRERKGILNSGRREEEEEEEEEGGGYNLVNSGNPW